jgi:hypothetical protein
VSKELQRPLDLLLPPRRDDVELRLAHLEHLLEISICPTISGTTLQNEMKPERYCSFDKISTPIDTRVRLVVVLAVFQINQVQKGI